MKLHFHFHGRLFLTLFLLRLLHGGESTQPPFSCDSSDPKTKSFKFCQTSLPIRERVRDLVSRLTLDEKISQLVDSANAIPRLGVPGYQWWSEALHGVSGYGHGVSFNGAIGGATSFPQVILSASTFDSQLWYRIGQAIGKEARGMYNGGQARGMTFWTPNINIFRDPRWGRGQETPGEDPMIASKYAVAYVRGIQGNKYNGGQSRNLLASACCKHFTAYDLDSWKGVGRFGFDAKVTQQDLADTYQPPFKSCVQEGKATGIMCAYNSVNGVPNCADKNLLTNTARGQWGFHGYIVSDCDAVATIHDNHKYVKEPEDAVALALKAGMDVNCGTYLKKYTKSALEKKKLPESQVDRALHNLFEVRMRLGLFNGNPRQLPYGNIGRADICSQAHQELALEAARNGIVLLKNNAKLLPLSKSKTSSLAVVGPNANNAYVLRGNYDGPPCKNVEILKALKGYVANTLFDQGCNFVNCTSASTEAAVGIAKEADYVILVMGLDQTQETEAHDRIQLTLPGLQETLIKTIVVAAKNPVILVLVTGGPVDVGFAKNNPKIGSILWAGYPGEAGGIALSQIIFGEHNPGGKLPMTWYPKEFISVPMTDMRMRPDSESGYPGRTYRFYDGPKVFEFGYGLSYTTYSYDFMQSTPNTINLRQLMPSLHATAECSTSNSSSIRALSVSNIGINMCRKLRFSVHVGVENTGSMLGKHPVLLFVRHQNHVKGSPMKQLVGFETVRLNPRERAEIKFVLNPCKHLTTTKEDGSMVIEQGYRYLMVEDKKIPINIVL
ncbi:Glycosyl hydrolase family protein [Perilla frutescens var. frutescens]|nr:Glycosyl hydrolase family protein [Perilla frutescens var. frutescens]